MSSRNQQERMGTAGYLPRGGACVSCRRRKMKCDAARPVCTQCERGGRSEDCEYLVGQERSTVQILEDNISRLEARIQELQNPDVAQTMPVNLHQPYVANGSGQAKAAPTSSHARAVQDPPRHVAEALLSGFLPYASEMGLFLNIPCFHASILQAHPIGHQSRPAPALIYATYLWAIRLSRDPSVKAYESAYLHRATQDAATILSGSHPNKILHSIQAEVLLATYFFANGRFFEGKYHLSNAVSTVFSARMHKIRSSEPSQQQVASQSSRMPSPRDPVEEGERIIGLWTVLTLDKTWAVALESPPNFEHSMHALATKVDTPWPLEMEDFEHARLPQQVRTAATIHNFLGGVPTPDLGVSSRAIETKAAILWERVNIFARNCGASSFFVPFAWPSNPSNCCLQSHLADNTLQQDLSPFLQEFTNLSALLDAVIGRLPSLDPQAIVRIQNAEQARRFSVAYTILNAAAIRLHAPFALSGRSETSKNKRITAARTVLLMIVAVRSRGDGYLNPIVGTAWIEASQVLFEEVNSIRAIRSSGNWNGGASHHSPPDERPILGLIRQAVGAMTDYSVNIPLTSFQVGRIQETLRAM
ncbi:hypothetical protein M413DRAFT_449285 [Hebeloma cylindrosporum]|uniref:Zn(2)-C6 fungal-type domain-containing protein n=1 Tax=Hebeloma cylindrosporum TaxID=76867 RepID=A0A0C2Y5B0_HEBCY|nr:hypothetical protein M413DRAFT_449285 [Hebeloma cylindrosporum h7]